MGFKQAPINGFYFHSLRSIKQAPIDGFYFHSCFDLTMNGM